MGYGGLINKITDPFGVGNTPAVRPPNPGQVGEDYMSLLQGFVQGAPLAYQTEARLQPRYAQLAMRVAQQQMPGVRRLWSAADPSGAGLMDTLTGQANSDLALGSSLSPDQNRQATQGVRAGAAERGLGMGPSDVFSEALGQIGYGDELQARRRAFASGVSQLRTERDNPAQMVAAAEGMRGGNSVMPGAQTYDMFNTAYNARAAASIATGNNRAAENSY